MKRIFIGLIALSLLILAGCSSTTEDSISDENLLCLPSEEFETLCDEPIDEQTEVAENSIEYAAGKPPSAQTRDIDEIKENCDRICGQGKNCYRDKYGTYHCF